MAIKTQYFNIKYPFTHNNEDGFFIDLNRDLNDKVGSEIAHVILTPKRTRIRMPDFGTDLIKYIFNPNDTLSWGEVEEEIKTNVSKYVNNVSINKVNVVKSDNDNAVYVDISYDVLKGSVKDNNRMVIKL